MIQKKKKILRAICIELIHNKGFISSAQPSFRPLSQPPPPYLLGPVPFSLHPPPPKKKSMTRRKFGLRTDIEVRVSITIISFLCFRGNK